MRFRKPKAIYVFIGLMLVLTATLGAGLGLALAETVNTMRTENFTEFETALPTKIYDINGRLITEFFAEEQRIPISIKELPDHLIEAFITREDQSFYSHNGFNLRSIMRAAIGQILGKSLGGGSTITQQLAGTLYADRRIVSLERKLKELWWALQLERRFTKEEILEMYLNRMIMGPAVYGVEAASRYFFGHPAKECTPAEAAILAIQLSSPSRYNPFRNPMLARERSKEILDQMVDRRVISRAEADESFDAYWASFDYSRIAVSAFYRREDKAPWFSEYVRRQLEDMFYGSIDMYSDGLSVYTTLDLDKQAAADLYMKRGIETANASFKTTMSQRLTEAERTYVPIIELLGLGFDIPMLYAPQSRSESASQNYFFDIINPILDATSLMLNIPSLKPYVGAASAKIKTELEKSTVEGALVTIDNNTGYILALVGGSDYSQANQLIRATQSKIMPGSTFKPLYYSAAIDSKKITEATYILDEPTTFYNEDGTPYSPQNFKGEWKGSVLAWQALAHSMNVASVKVLQTVGFDAAISRAAALLDITDPIEIRKTFPRYYPLALGVIGVTPLKMARAYAVFANGGKAITPIAIRYIEDRYGNIIAEPEKDALQTLRQKSPQVISSQNAAIMIDMLKRVVFSGTLAGTTQSGSIFRQKTADGHSYVIPIAGKTGTTENWADAWTIGSSPYYTTAVWLGFDRPGNSLGVSQTGATLAAPVWANYMRDIHLGLQYKNFPKPDSGLISATVCSLSGQLPTEFCSDGTINLLFLEGTEPTHFCELHHPVIAPEPIDSTDRLDFEEPILSRPEESPIFQNR
ncbi:MAG TPA: PBP1A family penicillin-binding protein [Rectinema sp.]|nr:PBP1A family penicillin-binding protein [Rectinema sp.]HPN92437.1 PBP1A family penicillin-binding protein [Rectinema sp.]